MPVFHKQKLIHVHIPKTGGTAIARYFDRIGGMGWGPGWWYGQARHYDRWYEYQHLSAEELRDLAGSNFSGFTSFVVVRDPLTRLISDFLWRQRIQKHCPDSPALFFDSFGEFLDAIPDDIDSRFSRHIQGADKPMSNFLIHVRPQFQYVVDDRGRILVDAIIRYEYLDSELAAFLRHFGLHADNIVRPVAREPADFYTDEQRRRVERIYARDFELNSASGSKADFTGASFTGRAGRAPDTADASEEHGRPSGARSLQPVFVHISKNAGRSIARTAGGAIRAAGHRTAASWIDEHGRQGPLFAVVRNPFDRVLSEYSFRRRRYLRNEQNPHLANLDKPFDDWVISTYGDGEFRSRDFFEASGVPYDPSNMIGDCLIWFLPQVRWISDDDGNLLVDETLRYETLGIDWRRFAKKYGLSETLAHENVSERTADYRDCYSKRSREVVQDYFKMDLEAFEYSFD